MAYKKTVWKARVGKMLNRFLKFEESPQSVVLVNAPDSITEEGTGFTSDNMNHIEQGIEDLDNNKAQAGNGTAAGGDSFLTQVQSSASAAPTNTARTLGGTNMPAITPGTSTANFGTASIAARTLTTWVQEIANKINGLFSMRGVANGFASLDAGAKIPIAQIPDAVVGNLLFGGTVSFAANVPTASINADAVARINAQGGSGAAAGNLTLLNQSGGNGGWAANKAVYYIVNAVTGTHTGFGGAGDFNVGDWIISSGTAWYKIDNTDLVTSVNGRIGAVVVTKSDVGLGNVPNVDSQNANNLNNGTVAAARLPNMSLTADTGTGTDTTTGAVAATAIATILQTIWGKIRQVANAKQNNLNRTVGGNDNATGSVTDTGGSLSVPTPVTVVAPAASSTQITAGTRTLRATLKVLIDNLAYLFSNTSAGQTPRYAHLITDGRASMTIFNDSPTTLSDKVALNTVLRTLAGGNMNVRFPASGISNSGMLILYVRPNNAGGYPVVVSILLSSPYTIKYDDDLANITDVVVRIA